MRIDTDEEYKAALERLAEIGADPSEGSEQDEFFEINSAMVEYETRNHPALERGGPK